MGNAQHPHLSVVDEDTRRRVIQLTARVGVQRAKRMLGASDLFFEALRNHGAARQHNIDRIRARLAELERQAGHGA